MCGVGVHELWLTLCIASTQPGMYGWASTSMGMRSAMDFPSAPGSGFPLVVVRIAAGAVAGRSVTTVKVSVSP